LNSLLLGRMMMTVPMKPPATSSQRRADTLSLSKVAASSVMASGVIMTMAVNSPTGMYLRLSKGQQAGGQQQHAAQAPGTSGVPGAQHRQAAHGEHCEGWWPRPGTV
jgi:hypothetical protein